MIITKQNFKFWVNSPDNPKWVIPIPPQHYQTPEDELENLYHSLFEILIINISNSEKLTEQQKNLFKVRDLLPEMIFNILNKLLPATLWLNQIQKVINPNVNPYKTDGINILNLVSVQCNPTLHNTQYQGKVFDYQIEYLNLSDTLCDRYFSYITEISLKDFMESNPLKKLDFWELPIFQYLDNEQTEYLNKNIKSGNDSGWTMWDLISENINGISNQIHDSILNFYKDENGDNEWVEITSTPYGNHWEMCDEMGYNPTTTYIKRESDFAQYFYILSMLTY